MGTIKSEIMNLFLAEHPEQESILKPFLNGFDINYAEVKSINNTTIFSYMIKPEDFMKEAFGLEKEILLVYSPFDTLEPRALQAANMLFKMFPYMNRIDTLNFFMVSKDPAIQNYAGIMSFSEEESRSLVPFLYSDLISSTSDNWYVRKILKKNFYDVDLFGYTLPIRDEASFLGGTKLLHDTLMRFADAKTEVSLGYAKQVKHPFCLRLIELFGNSILGLYFFMIVSLHHTENFTGTNSLEKYVAM